MNFHRKDNGYYIDIETGIEYQSTWRFHKDYKVSLNDMSVLNMARNNRIPHHKQCRIEFEAERKIYGDFVYMYPLEWLKGTFLTNDDNQ